VGPSWAGAWLRCGRGIPLYGWGGTTTQKKKKEITEETKKKMRKSECDLRVKRNEKKTANDRTNISKTFKTEPKSADRVKIRRSPGNKPGRLRGKKTIQNTRKAHCH